MAEEKPKPWGWIIGIIAVVVLFLVFAFMYFIVWRKRAVSSTGAAGGAQPNQYSGMGLGEGGASGGFGEWSGPGGIIVPDSPEGGEEPPQGPGGPITAVQMDPNLIVRPRDDYFFGDANVGRNTPNDVLAGQRRGGNPQDVRVGNLTGKLLRGFGNPSGNTDPGDEADKNEGNVRLTDLSGGVSGPGGNKLPPGTFPYTL